MLKYISIKLISITSYLLILLIIFTFGIDDILNAIFPAMYITLEQFSLIYVFLLYLIIFLFCLFFIEKFVNKNKPKKTNKVIIKNKFVKILFNFGIGFAIFNIILMLLFLFFYLINS